MMMNGENVYFNMICEEVYVTGGKIIHIDRNAGSEEDVHNLFWNNVFRYPGAKWEIYPNGIILPKGFCKIK